MTEKRVLYFEIFLISVATLILESTLLRIFAISEWYHFAFISISIALLGFGASGTYLSMDKVRANRTTMFLILPILFSISVAISYFVINFVPFDSYRIAWERVQILYLGMYYLALSLPFFFCGLCVGLAIVSFPEDVNKLYFLNLTGSASGCLIAIPLLSFFTPPQIILIIYLAGIVSAIIIAFCGKYKFHRYISFFLLIPAIYLIFAPAPTLKTLRMSPYKDLSILKHYPGAKILDSKFNAFSQIDIIQAPGIKYAPGLSPAYKKPAPEQLGITIDGTNLSGIINKIPAQEFPHSLATALPYEIMQRKNILILEPCTGIDVLVGLASNPESITIVENNSLLSNLIKKYSEVYKAPSVSLILKHPRSAIKRLKKKFNLIQISLSDPFNANFAASFSLNENYIYTTEALSDYFNCLSPDGMLAIHRWIQFPPSEELKTLLAICSSIPQPHRKILAIRTWRTCLILVKKTDLTTAEIKKAKQFCSKNKFDFIYFPKITQKETALYTVFKEDPYYKGFKELLLGNREKFCEDYKYDIRPATDNRPFFFHYFKWRNVPLILKTLGKTMQPFGGGGYLVLFILLAFAIIIGAIFILLPLKIIKQEIKINQKFLLYFLLLGIGFLFVEIPLISKFILLLGLPVYAFTVVAFSILFFSGLGSLLSARWNMKLRIYSILILGVALFILNPLISFSLDFLLSQSLFIRAFLSIILLAPFAFLMGIPFPSAIKIINEQNPSFIPWAWAINGYTSVVASILATILSVSFGFNWTLFCAAIAYILAFLIICDEKEQIYSRPYC